MVYLSVNVFNTGNKLESFIDFFKNKGFVLKKSSELLNDDFEGMNYNFMEIDEFGNLLLIGIFSNSEEISKYEREFRKNLYLSYQILIKNDFTEFRFIKYDYGIDKILRLTKKRSDLKPIFLIKLKSLQFNLLQSFENLFDRSEFIKEFYQLYCKTEDYLISKIKGINNIDDKSYFAKLLIERLMFLWFTQKKNFLNNDEDYFLNKYKEISDKGLNYYSDFLQNLFFNGLCRKKDKREKEIDELIGDIPYLNGGLFTKSDVEIKFGDDIEIDNDAFYQSLNYQNINSLSKIPVLNLLACREWTVDERSGDVNKINPEVLGYIFEKSVNKRELGAVYTPIEITAFICRNTIHPFILEKFRNKFGLDISQINNFQVDFLEQLNNTQLLELFSILKEIKILDPAVGSGHFLVDIMIYLENIYKFLKSKSIIGWSDFEIREYIIINNLYGVDIIPEAIEITKLRMFLALAETFQLKEEIKPLPNIDFNFRCGNSIIGFTNIEDISQTIFNINETVELFTSNFDSLSDMFPIISKSLKKIIENESRFIKIIDLFRIRNEIIDEFEKLHYHEKQIEIRNLLDAITESFNQQLNQMLYGKLHTIFDRVKQLKTKPQVIKFKTFLKLKPFHWVMEFSEVIGKGGFDLVIGNPPYVKSENINKNYENFSYKEILSLLFKESEQSFDLSLYFIIRSLELLIKNGIHSFIITNKWLRSKYGTKIRKLLSSEKTLMKIIDFNSFKVFKGAQVDTMIYIVKNATPEKDNEIYYGEPKNFQNLDNMTLKITQTSLSSEIWTFYNKDLEEIKKWIEKKGSKLKDLRYIIKRGLTTGFNDAFIIDNKTRISLIKQDSKSDEFIKPTIKGTNINRYFVENEKNWIIVIPCGFTNQILKKEKIKKTDAEKTIKKHLPAIYNHLYQIGISQKGKGKGLFDRYDMGNYWWELRSCDFYDDFNKPKLIWQEISMVSQYYWDFKEKFYLQNNAYFGVFPKYFIAILNSKLIETYFSTISQTLSNGRRHTQQYVENIPIVETNKPEVYEILVDCLQILKDNKGYDDYFMYLDKEIMDSLIYELYFGEKIYGQETTPKLLALIEINISPLNHHISKESITSILKIIDNLKSNSKIKELIKIIKENEWVKIIEE